MIFPLSCKFVGNASSMPYGEKVYFLTRYLIHQIDDGSDEDSGGNTSNKQSFEVFAVKPADGLGLMREIAEITRIAGPDDIAIWSEEVNPHNRADLISKALSTGKRCTIFGSQSDHMTFVCDPSFSEFDTVHVFDNVPLRATLSETLKVLESVGYFEADAIRFEHHVRNIAHIEADVYPCRAAGLSRAIDRDNLRDGDKVACCKTGRQICNENTSAKLEFEEICPTHFINAEPFITRCCRVDEAGIQEINGFFGVVVHWVSSPREVSEALDKMLFEWRKRKKMR